MIRKLKTESEIEEIHRIRREISDRFAGDIVAIANDAARRLAASGRPVWQPKPPNFEGLDCAVTEEDGWAQRKD
jgi:hypothetical protein